MTMKRYKKIMVRLNNKTELELKDKSTIPAGQAKFYELKKSDGTASKQFIIYKGQILQKE